MSHAIAEQPHAREGYLVVADISGYTAFLKTTELEHAQAIIEELTSLIRDRLAPPLRFVKTEGDAVLTYAHAAAFTDGERLIEVLETCYRDFQDRIFDMARATTCPCTACASIDTLDLKFVTHYGTFVVQAPDGLEDVAGSDVILVHRLLKNSIAEQTGCRAYVLLTDAALERMPSSLGLPRHTERYESFGSINGGVLDLGPVLSRLREAQREYITADVADFQISGEGPFPPAVVWQYCVDPDKRARWVANEISVKYHPNSAGRVSTGATSHCAHRIGADAVRHYIDWRPFRYFTNTMMSPKGLPIWTETYEFIPREDGGTQAHVRIRLADRTRFSRLRFRFLVAPIVRMMFRRSVVNLLRLLEQEANATQVGPDDAPASERQRVNAER